MGIRVFFIEGTIQDLQFMNMDIIAYKYERKGSIDRLIDLCYVKSHSIYSEVNARYNRGIMSKENGVDSFKQWFSQFEAHLVAVAPISEKVIVLHNTFDRNWKDSHQESFHNYYHLLAVFMAGISAVNDMERRSGSDFLDKDVELTKEEDPLQIKKSLRAKRARELGFDKYSLADFKQALTIFAWTHDLGDIARVEDGEIIFFEEYTKGEHAGRISEERSVDCARIVLDEVGRDRPEFMRLQPLVEALTMQTTFMPDDREAPFALFARVCDQIGNACFNASNYLKGLVEEYIAAGDETLYKIRHFVNFADAQVLALGRFFESNPWNLKKYLASIWEWPVKDEGLEEAIKERKKKGIYRMTAVAFRDFLEEHATGRPTRPWSPSSAGA